MSVSYTLLDVYKRQDAGYDIKETILLPDEQKKLEKELIRLADQRQLNVIFTTGGTGFSERDRTRCV